MHAPSTSTVIHLAHASFPIQIFRYYGMSSPATPTTRATAALRYCGTAAVVDSAGSSLNRTLILAGIKVYFST